MIKNILKRRKGDDTYLATFRRHRWSAQMTVKKDNLLESYFLVGINSGDI